MLERSVHMPGFQSSSTLNLPRIQYRQLPSHADQVHRDIWGAREVLRRQWHADPSQSQQARKHHTNRGKEDPMGVHGHGVQLEKRSGGGDDKISEAHPGSRTGKKGASTWTSTNKVDTTLRRVGEILNRRPLVVKVGQDDQYYAITPADLLFGKASEAPSSTEEGTLRETDK